MHSKRVIDAARRVEEEFGKRVVAADESNREWRYSQKLMDALWRDDCKAKLLELQDAHIVAQALLFEETGSG